MENISLSHEDELQRFIKDRVEVPMPWIGGYITLASAICTFAMAVDALDAIRHRKLWFPCRYFSLDSTSLTLLSVAMKLPMDLTSVSLYPNADSLAKFSSLIFMSTAMANFMSSLGSLNNKNILPNVVGLGILVITIAADVLIDFVLVPDRCLFSMLISITLMLLMLATLVSLAITVPAIKRSLESVYQERYKVALMKEEVLERRKAFSIDVQRRYMTKYWVMAETSSPQFVIARSVICATSAVICLIALVTLPIFYAQTRSEFYSQSFNYLKVPESPYRESTKWIIYFQSIGIAVGTIAPVLRWFLLVSFKCTMTNRNSFKKGFKIETYWIQTLVDWRDSFSNLHMPQGKCRKCLHGTKWFAISFCIGLQSLNVRLSKLFVFISVSLMSPFFVCFTHMKIFMMKHSFINVIASDQSRDDEDLNLSDYVLLLEGEEKLPRRLLKNICCEANNMIETGRKKQPKNLVKLQGKFDNFSGVGQFDSSQIPSLLSEEPPNCWTLPVVTLTSIAIALPNITKHNRKQLLSSVSEGLSLAKLVDKTHDKNNHDVSIRKAADICWVGVVLYMKWLEIDLRRTSHLCKNSKEVLQELSNKAKEIIMEFKKEERTIMGIPLNSPAKVVAANSMYRISETILLSCEGENELTDKGLFEHLSVMIADILAACLTSLPHVITTMCQRNAIEKREKSVRKAFLLLGKTEQIVEHLHQHQWPSMDHDNAACIENWRALFQKNKGDSSTVTSASSGETEIAPLTSGKEHLAIKVDSLVHLPSHCLLLKDTERE